MIFCLIQAYDVVGGLNSYVKIISFILEVDAGLAMLANHYVIWYLGIYKDKKKKKKRNSMAGITQLSILWGGQTMQIWLVLWEMSP